MSLERDSKRDRWQQVSELYDAALRYDASERAAFLREACGSDDALRREIDSLLAHEQTVEEFTAAPAVEMLAQMASKDHVQPLIGRHLGSYKILSFLGAGGMGEVYRARDTKLGRDVAIKVLPASLARDADRLHRLEREARLLAALNHPHIGAIHGMEHVDGVPALILELVEGQTLADVIAGHQSPEAESLGSRPRDSEAAATRGSPEPGAPGTGPRRREIGWTPRHLEMNDALAIAGQIAEALEAAHEKGIIHRDLKPANIKLTPDGTVKVLDFGLAKAFIDDGSGPDLSRLPTVTMKSSHEGAIAGTAPYMSPEQARGKAVDKRTDIWAFGCVLYEMLTGGVAFKGETISDTIAAILAREPDWRALPAQTPPTIRRLLQRCLDKDPKRRLRDIGDTRLEIEDALTDDRYRNDVEMLKHAPDPHDPSLPLAAPVRSDLPRGERLAWGVAGVATLLLLMALVAGGLYVRRAAPEPVVTRLEVVTPSTPDSGAFALSPDGRQLVFIGRAEGRPRLWLRPLDQAAAHPLIGTDGGSGPFWAPDGRAIGFFADGNLKRINLTDGALQVLANASAGRGGTWNQDGIIVFAPTSTSGLMRVAATGGTPVAVTQPAPGQGSHRWPQFLPDGRRFLFGVGVGRPDMRGVFVGSIDGDMPKRVVADETAAMYAPPDWLLVVRQHVLMALRFDPTRAVVSGDPMPVAQNVGDAPGLFRAAFSVSTNGVVAHRPGGAQRRQFMSLDRTGRVLGTIGPPDDAAMANLSLAPDGQRLAMNRVVQNNIDVWLMDVTRGIASRFTFEPSIENLPLWSRDGRRVAFRSTRNGPYDLFEKPASGAGEEHVLLQTAETKAPMDWSPDGRTLLYATLDPKTGTADLWALPTVGERKPYPVVQTSFDESNGQFSPDGKWLAYESNESGRFEIYVQPFPGPGTKSQVSTAGGSQPCWRSDGKELFYVATDGHMMATPVAVGSDTQLQAGAPVPLFTVQLASGPNVFGPGGASKSQYAVTPDGRFLMNVALDETNMPPIAVVLNWDAGLRK